MVRTMFTLELAENPPGKQFEKTDEFSIHDNGGRTFVSIVWGDRRAYALKSDIVKLAKIFEEVK